MISEFDARSEERACRPGRTRLAPPEASGAAGYAESSLLEKWARDSKILDIFEGTQQIQLLIIARRLLTRASSELR